jgi:hypothetical protein
MDLSSKLTMYDFFAMVIPGLLILLLFRCIVGCYLSLNCEMVNNGWFIVFVLIFSYLIGLLWNKFMELFFCKFRNCNFFIKQQYNKFALDYKKESGKEINGIDKNFKHEYYKAYYFLMEKNCLNSIPVLEAQVALVRNLIVLILFYIIIFIHCDNVIYHYVKSQLHNTFGLAILLLIIFIGMICLLFKIQDKIYYLIWEGYEYIKCNEDHFNNGARPAKP